MTLATRSVGKGPQPGPRYERDGSTRMSWEQPVAWAGLDKVPPTRAEEISALQRRASDIEVELDAAELRLAEEISRLRSLHEGTRALTAEGESTKASYGAAQAAVDATRTQITSLSAEQQAVSRALVTPLPPEPVHAHLRHRQLPNQDVLRPAHWALRLGAAISVSVLLLAVAALIVLEQGSTLNLVIGVTGWWSLLRPSRPRCTAGCCHSWPAS